MTTEPTSSQATRAVLRVAVRTAGWVAGVVGGLFCYFVCQGMFAGYPKWHTGLLSLLGTILIALTGGLAWLVDERRLRDDD